MQKAGLVGCTMEIGLRIDVDSFRGTRYGVPKLCELLAAYSIKASFFFSVGPDNMGRHIWRMIRPSFFWKMLRTRAPGLYGWDILFRGTFRQGPIIGKTLSPIIHSAAREGHEVGVHAWDHHAWQTHIGSMDAHTIYGEIGKAVELLKEIIGKTPACSASPGWKCNELVLLEKGRFPFAFNSDCRGEDIFYPVVRGRKLSQPQIPVTLPTYDEVIGRKGIKNSNYNDYLISQLKRDGLNTLTIHAEVEGIALTEMFEGFLLTARTKGASFVPLGKLIKNAPPIGAATVVPGQVQGREGWVSCQAPVTVKLQEHGS